MWDSPHSLGPQSVVVKVYEGVRKHGTSICWEGE